MQGELLKMFGDIPEAVVPVLPQTHANEASLAYEGNVTFRTSSLAREIPCRISIAWLPEPRVRIEAGPCDTTIFDVDGPVEIEVEGSSAAALMLDYDFEDQLMRGILNGALTLRREHQFEAVHFGLVNFHKFYGKPIAMGNRTWRGRLELQFAGFNLLIDEVANFDALTRSLKADGGFAVTHACRLTRVNGEALSDSEVTEILAGLHFIFGFMRGYWAGPVAASSVAGVEGGSCILENWKVDRWRHVGSWFPRDSAVGDLNNLLTRFIQLWGTPEWVTPIRHFVWWYIESNTANSLESAITTAQTGLELIGWVHLVETRKVLSAKGFDQLPAADKVRLLLTDLRIPATLPSHLLHLGKFAAAHGHTDGPGAFVDLRNAIMHPSLKKRDRLAASGNAAKFEAAELARQYLEYVFLSMLGYQGIVRDRTMRAASLPYERPAPWAGQTSDV